jgi:hypothetical protein
MLVVRVRNLSTDAHCLPIRCDDTRSVSSTTIGVNSGSEQPIELCNLTAVDADRIFHYSPMHNLPAWRHDLRAFVPIVILLLIRKIDGELGI